jgi:sulfur-oxidizing protein SoxA
MREAATQFPKWSVKQQKLINLEDQILTCSERTSRPLKGLENTEVLSHSALLHWSSAGLPFQISPKEEIQQRWQVELNAGAKLFTTRMGRMNLACTHCHDLNIGKTMRADVISPGHPTGFPIFKLSWQSMGSIDRRLRACYSGVQAEVPAPGSPELRQLELFLKSRAQGMTLEGPSLRR